MARPIKIIQPWQFDGVCDAADDVGNRTLAKEMGLSSPGLADTIRKKECGDPVARARRLGLPLLNTVLQTIPAVSGATTTALTIPQTSTVNVPFRQLASIPDVAEKSVLIYPSDKDYSDVADYEDEDYNFSDSYSPFGPDAYTQSLGFPNATFQPYTIQQPGSQIARLPDIMFQIMVDHFARKTMADVVNALPPITPQIVWLEASSKPAPTIGDDRSPEETESTSPYQHFSHDEQSADVDEKKASATAVNVGDYHAEHHTSSDIDELDKSEEPTEHKLDDADNSIEEAESCSCPRDKGRSQDPRKPPEAISDQSSGTPVMLGSSPDEKSVKEQQDTQQSDSGNVNQPPQDPPLSPGAGETSNPTGTLPGTGTTPLTGVAHELPKIPDETRRDQSGSTGNEENAVPATIVGGNIQSVPQPTEAKPPVNTLLGPTAAVSASPPSNQIGSNVITGQLPVVEVQASPRFGINEVPPLQPVDTVRPGQQPAGTSGGLAPQHSPPKTSSHTLIPNPSNSPTDTANGGGKDEYGLLSQRQVRMSDSNEHNDSLSDFLLWAILGVLALAFGIGVIRSYINQNKNQQPTAQLEPRALLNPQLIVAEEETKPPPPTLYSVQPQGDAAGIRIF